MRVCSEQGCDSVLGRYNKTGLCRACCARSISARPDVAKKRSIGVSRHYDKPGTRERHSEIARKSWQESGDERREQSRLQGKRRAASWTPEEMQASHDKRLSVMFPWLPRAYRPLFRELRRKRFSLDDCRRLIAEQAAKDRAKAKQDRRPIEITFAEKLALVEQGRASIAPAFVRHHLQPRIGA